MYFILCQRADHRVSLSKRKAGNTIWEVKLSPSALFAKNSMVYGGVQPDPSPHMAGSRVDNVQSSWCHRVWVHGCSREGRRDTWGRGAALSRRLIIASNILFSEFKKPQHKCSFSFDLRYEYLIELPCHYMEYIFNKHLELEVWFALSSFQGH